MSDKDQPLERVRVFGDPVLREESREVTEFDEKLARLVEIMFEPMDQADGVGLAATQIGVQKQVAVWRHPETEEAYVLVNPHVLERSQETEVGSEGCLSVPGCTGKSRGHSGCAWRRATTVATATRSRPTDCSRASSSTRWTTWRAG